MIKELGIRRDGRNAPLSPEDAGVMLALLRIMNAPSVTSLDAENAPVTDAPLELTSMILEPPAATPTLLAPIR